MYHQSRRSRTGKYSKLIRRISSLNLHELPTEDLLVEFLGSRDRGGGDTDPSWWIKGRCLSGLLSLGLSAFGGHFVIVRLGIGGFVKLILLKAGRMEELSEFVITSSRNGMRISRSSEVRITFEALAVKGLQATDRRAIRAKVLRSVAWSFPELTEKAIPLYIYSPEDFQNMGSEYIYF
jgi:hypothetical protein